MGAFACVGKTCTLVFWTTKDKTIVGAGAFSYYGFLKTIYEFDASTLNMVGPPFEGHTKAISSLALLLDRALSPVFLMTIPSSSGLLTPASS